ncbi:MAG TPA: phosphatase PAP2 family protein [Chryseolinea sp.]|nr:phosphatase PAP2 family protein [Chryseolinea sp.]
MLILVWVIAPGFNGCAPGSLWCLAMYWITQSGGWIGSFIIVLIISTAFAFIPLHPRARFVMFVRTLLSLTIILGGFAKLNETFIKSTFAVSRPSHRFILRESQSRASLDSIYMLVVPQRRLFFKKVVDGDTLHFKSIDQRVLAHWIDEAGYSMPSGHTFNAFLLASMLTFSLFELNQRRVTVGLLVPMIWATLVGLSRVSLGVHTPLDVTIGGALGLLVSHGLLAIPYLNRLLVPRRIAHHSGTAKG